MFFAPPRVKSLSRYAEYGAYLGHKHFLMMLAIAMAAHLAVIGIYSMVPRQQVIKIPVRAINIKLTGGGSLAAGQMPLPSAMPDVKNSAAESDEELPSRRAMRPVRESSAAAAMDNALKGKHAAHPQTRPARTAEEARKSTPDAAPQFTMPTPKRYVREKDVGAGKGSGSGKTDGNGSEIDGDVGGTEVVHRYTQTISQWIKNHQIYARAVCGEVQAAGGQCEAKGQVVVRLRIDRDGHILFNSVERTSGKELVDQAAIAMVRASNPVPAVPGNFPGSQLEFLIAVQVDLSKQ